MPMPSGHTASTPVSIAASSKPSQHLSSTSTASALSISSSSSDSAQSPIYTPVSTPTPAPTPGPTTSATHPPAAPSSLRRSIMDPDASNGVVAAEQRQPDEPASTASAAAQTDPLQDHVDPASATTTATTTTARVANKKTKCRKPEHRRRKKSGNKKSKKTAGGAKADDGDDDDSSSDSSSESSSDADDSSSSSSSDNAHTSRRSGKTKSRARTKKTRPTKTRKSKRHDSSSDSESDADESEDERSASSSDEEPRKKSHKKKKLGKKAGSKKTPDRSRSASPSAASDADDADSDNDDVADYKRQIADLEAKIKRSRRRRRRTASPDAGKSSGRSSKTRRRRSADALQFRRVDELWDTSIHNYKLRESAEGDDSEFAEFAFLVRRTFDYENEYRKTLVDIKSKQLRAALVEVMRDCKSVSLEAEEPTLDPNTLFLYLEQLRVHYKKTLKARIKTERRKKNIRRLEQQRSLVKLLVGYIDEDYEDTKKRLYPLLKAGNITFDLIWALFHPNDIAITSCYGVWDEPRCFKVEQINKCSQLSRGEWYSLEGKYLEFDGKMFGYGAFETDIDSFKGPRKITSLPAYPLRLHREPEAVRRRLIERGQRFVTLEGMHYRFHKGMAFVKKKKQVLKININGRIMVDPATFRRINPNYPISFLKPKDSDDMYSDDEDSGDNDDSCSCGGYDSDGIGVVVDNSLQCRDTYNGGNGLASSPEKSKFTYAWTKDSRGRSVLTAVEIDAEGKPVQHGPDAEIPADLLGKPQFTEEELLLTSPVVLGFAFSEKLWLEFTLADVRDIEYNDKAFDSLVLPPNHKSIVRALVESHTRHSARTIDDVVQGKGKGLVAVLHGPPGTGKTLTAEGISELLRCPLYMVSAGELGTDPVRLEHELQRVLDIAHSWGAVLLLDEADVFLEKREMHDIHRNALVSTFLRLLEYYQGILFLTTNRVETFDDAFQSRIHVALRYGELTHKARKTVWSMFIDMVRKVEGMQVAAMSDADLESLARHQLNGRQIKNVVRTAQALALNEKTALTLSHIYRVLDVAETFDRDLKGGTGYLDAMRSYT